MTNTSVLQLYPNRITITEKRQPLNFAKVKFNKQCKSFLAFHKAQAVENFKAVKNPFILSKASKKKLLDSINSMYFLSEPRKIEMKTKKFIYNYRMSFITLTLPSKQKHSDVEIKKECLNQFLIEIRKHYGINNYVWKAELQKNDNIHFHLIVDKYIDFQAIRRRWNRIVNKLGYVDAYTEKMQKLSFAQYCETSASRPDHNIKTLHEVFAKQKRSGFKNPNSVDVRSVYSKKELAIYLSKYIAKPVSKNENNISSEARQISFGRSWYRSYSLSTLEYKNKFLACEMKNLINYLRSVKDLVLEISNDFFTAFYFSAETLNTSFKAFHKKFIFENARMYNYPFP